MGKIIILGAGASYGNGICELYTNISKPPLISNFFNSKEFDNIEQQYSPLINYIAQLSELQFGKENKINVETIFADIEGSWNLDLYDDWEEISNVFGDSFICSSPVDWLRSLVNDIIFSTTTWLNNWTCPYHDKLVEKAIEEDDVIISFNYDLIADCSLKKSKMWHETTGYGFNKKLVRKKQENLEDSIIKLFKPHGSLNWFKSHFLQEKNSIIKNYSGNKDNQLEKVHCIEILSLNETMQGNTFSVEKKNSNLGQVPRNIELFLKLASNVEKGSLEYIQLVAGFSKNMTDSGFLPLIVVPTPNKSYDEMKFGELKSVWREIKEKIDLCDEIISIGFSFQDKHFNQILSESAITRTNVLKITSYCPIKEFNSPFKTKKINFKNEDMSFRKFVESI